MKKYSYFFWFLHALFRHALLRTKTPLLPVAAAIPAARAPLTIL